MMFGGYTQCLVVVVVVVVCFTTHRYKTYSLGKKHNMTGTELY